MVDSDAVKNALKAGDGAADATAQAIKRSADVLIVRQGRHVGLRQGGATSGRGRVEKRTAPRSASSSPDLVVLCHPSTRRASTGFADAGKKISASVDAKTLTTNLDAGMKQLGKNLLRSSAVRLSEMFASLHAIEQRQLCRVDGVEARAMLEWHGAEI